MLHTLCVYNIMSISLHTKNMYILLLLFVGVVSTENLGRVMNAFGLDPSQEELKNMITEVDGSGMLDRLKEG